MLTNESTPFDELGWACAKADIRRLFLLVGGGSNDLNQASTDVTQDATTAGENANNAFKIRGVNVDTAAPVDGSALTFSKDHNRWEANSGTGTAGASLKAGNNLSDVSSAATSRTNLGLGTAALLSSTGVALTANNLSDLGSNVTARSNLGLGTSSNVTFNNVATNSGVSLGAYLRLHATIATGNYALGDNDCYVVASGVIVTLPSVAGRSGVTYFVGSAVGATAQVDAQVGQTVRGATGVTLTAGTISTYICDGASWLEGRG